MHGGAPSRALALLEAIGTPENARPYLVEHIAQGEKIMGFGHRVYKTDDPRSLFLRGVAVAHRRRAADFAKQVEQHGGRGARPSSSPAATSTPTSSSTPAWSWSTAGLPPDLFTPTFASSRVIGWCANILEQASDNRIIRPSARYVGEPPPQPVPDAGT